jgi:hypothetical protein
MVHFLVGEILKLLKPHLPLWWEGVVSSLQDLLSVVPTSWFLVFAAGLAFPVVWDLVASRGEAIAGYGRALRAHLPLGGATFATDPTEPFSLSCKVREAEQLPKGSPLTKWVGIVVNPNVDLLDCEVRMVAIWRNGECLYDEPLNFIWSNSRDIRRTIRAGIQEAAALCMAEAGKPGLYPTTSILKPQIVRAMRKPESALYRVDVAVHATNSRVKRQWFVVEYGGDFDHIEIRPEAT